LGAADRWHHRFVFFDSRNAYGYAWVGDPAKAQLIRVRDTYAATP